jgi:hypothetical protein
MAKATVKYRCRNCSKTFEACRIPDLHKGLALLILNLPDFEKLVRKDWVGIPGRTAFHFCAEGEAGIGDVIALVEEK